jgi:hypothetical protein
MAAVPINIRGRQADASLVDDLAMMLDELYADIDGVLNDPSTHELLGDSHSDTVEATVARGDIITGQIIGTGTTLAWQQFALGTNGHFLKSDGTDLTYSAIQETDVADGSLLARVGSNETITGSWTFGADILLADTFYLRRSGGARIATATATDVRIGDPVANNNATVTFYAALSQRMQLSSTALTMANSAVFRSTTGSASAPAYSHTSDTNTGMYFDNSDDVLFSAGGTLKMTIAPTGVGINMTPLYELHTTGQNYFVNGVSGGFTRINNAAGITAAATTITVDSTTGFPTAGIIIIESEIIRYTGKTSTTLTGCVRGNFLSTAAAHADNTPVVIVPFVISSGDSDSGTVIFTGTSNLYLGGTTSISDALGVTSFKVKKFSYNDNFTYASIYDGTQQAFFGIDGTDSFFGSYTNHAIAFRVNNTEVVYIDTDGLMKWYGKTSSFPALKRSSAALHVRLADDSAFAELQCGALTINAQTGTVAGTTYTPVRSAEANLDANATMFEAQYIRTGNTVTVSGRFTADPTLAATATSFEMTLPIASNIGAVEDLAGVAFCGAIAGQGAQISGSVANNTAVVSWVSGDITSQSWSFLFTYQVI